MAAQSLLLNMNFSAVGFQKQDEGNQQRHHQTLIFLGKWCFAGWNQEKSFEGDPSFLIVQLSMFAKKHSSRELIKITEQTQLSFSGSSSYPHLQPSSFFSLLPSWHIMFHLFQTISWFTPKYFHVILISKCCMEYPLPGASSYKKLSFPEKRERYHTHTHARTHTHTHTRWNITQP